MTDKIDDNIDLTKEIEELDEFLDDQDVDFPLDDGDSDFGAPDFALGTPIEEEKKAKKKSNLGKFVGYLVFLCILFGGAYAVYLFAPQFIQKPQLEKVSAFVSNESGDVVGDLKDMFKSYVPTSDKVSQNEVIKNESNVPREPIDGISELPMPSDEELVEAEDVLSIADAMDFVNDATDTIKEPTVGDKQASAIIEDLESEIPNAPTVDLPALKEETIEVAQDAMGMSNDELTDIFEAVENMTAEEIVEIAKEDNIPTAPKIEMQAVEIETKKSVPVKVVSTPNKKKAAPKPSKPTDPRVSKAKSLFDNGDYSGALNLYRAILQSDPANTSALTGRQLAQAKMRMSGKTLRPARSIEVRAPEQPSGNIQALLNQAQANPSDAVTAFNVGNAYKGADNAKAMEWYRKALQIDVLYSSGLDRMSVYDAMADIQ